MIGTSSSKAPAGRRCTGLLLALLMLLCGALVAVCAQEKTARITPEQIARGRQMCDGADALLADGKAGEALVIYQQVLGFLSLSPRAKEGVRECRALLAAQPSGTPGTKDTGPSASLERPAPGTPDLGERATSSTPAGEAPPSIELVWDAKGGTTSNIGLLAAGAAVLVGMVVTGAVWWGRQRRAAIPAGVPLPEGGSEAGTAPEASTESPAARATDALSPPPPGIAVGAAVVPTSEAPEVSEQVGTIRESAVGTVPADTPMEALHEDTVQSSVEVMAPAAVEATAEDGCTEDAATAVQGAGSDSVTEETAHREALVDPEWSAARARAWWAFTERATHTCDVCRAVLSRGEGYVLDTEQMLRSESYLEFARQIGSLRGMGRELTVDEVAARVFAVPGPWHLCAQCFDQDFGPR